MKLKDEDFNVKELDVEPTETKFKRYTGEVPKTGTILIARVTRMWWTQSGDGTSQIFLMAFAEQNTGKLKEFNGLPIREYLTFKPTAAFRYIPALETLGFTLRDIKSKMIVEEEPDNIGDVITKIGDFVVGSDDALVRLVIKRERYEDEWNAKIDIDGWLPLEDEDEDEDDDEDDEDLDDEDEDEDEDEEDEPPARPARGRTTRGQARGGKAASSRSRRRAEPEPDDDEDDDEDIDDDYDEEEAEAEAEEAEDEDEEEEAPPARSRRGARSGRTSSRSSGTARATGSGRRGPASSRASDGGRSRSSRTSTRASSGGSKSRKGRDGGSTDDPPF
jgi:hypothetical protein